MGSRERYFAKSAVYGPVQSRRLGNSLGINFSFNKACTYDCIYCYLGRTSELPNYISPEQIISEFESYARRFEGRVDYVTFCGNGEPTMHPDFPFVVEHVLKLKAEYFFSVPSAIFSNASLISDGNKKEAVAKIDRVFLKLDFVDEKLFKEINRPLIKISLQDLLESLREFSKEKRFTIDTAIVLEQGYIDIYFRRDFMETWVEMVNYVNPEFVSLYPIKYHPDPSKEAEYAKLWKRERERLLKVLSMISEKLSSGGIKCKVYG